MLSSISLLLPILLTDAVVAVVAVVACVAGVTNCCNCCQYRCCCSCCCCYCFVAVVAVIALLLLVVLLLLLLLLVSLLVTSWLVGKCHHATADLAVVTIIVAALGRVDVCNRCRGGRCNSITAAKIGFR